MRPVDIFNEKVLRKLKSIKKILNPEQSILVNE